MTKKLIQQAFNSTRLSYKKMEWAVEYFTPDPARFINGPALDELEVAENTFIPPNGFQVIEELIFPNYSIENKAELIRKIKILSRNLKQIKEHLSVITISNAHIMDASKMELNRILALGITGFDSPIAFHSIPEAKNSLGSIGNLISKMDFKNPESIQCEKEIKTFMTVRNSYQESNILKMHFASLRLCAKLGSQRRRDAKSIKDKGCEKYSTTNLFCERVLVTDSHKNFN